MIDVLLDPLDSLQHPAVEDGPMRELVRRAMEGDDAAFEALYKASARTLLHAVRRICGEAHAEDVLSEAYFQAWSTLRSFDAARCSVVGWLVTIARSRARDRMRAERTRHGGLEGAVDFEADTQIHGDPGPEDHADAAQQRERLYGALGRLSGNERCVIGLAYMRDHTHTEISVLTGMPLGTVKSLICRGQARLRGMMQPATSHAISLQHADPFAS